MMFAEFRGEPLPNRRAMVSARREGTVGSRGQPPDVGVALVQYFLRMGHSGVLDISCGPNSPSEAVVLWLISG